MKEVLDRPVHLRVSTDLWDEIDKLAEKAERPPSAEIRLALKDWVKRQRKRGA